MWVLIINIICISISICLIILFLKDTIQSLTSHSRKKYLRIRTAILQNRYNVYFDKQSYNVRCAIKYLIIFHSYTTIVIFNLLKIYNIYKERIVLLLIIELLIGNL